VERDAPSPPNFKCSTIRRNRESVCAFDLLFAVVPSKPRLSSSALISGFRTAFPMMCTISVNQSCARKRISTLKSEISLNPSTASINYPYHVVSMSMASGPQTGLVRIGVGLASTELSYPIKATMHVLAALIELNVPQCAHLFVLCPIHPLDSPS
jgi:hypothetical protein